MVKLHEFPVPTEGIRFQNPSIVAVIEEADLGLGTLYVAERSLCWRSASSGEGFELEYPQMCLHAISRDVNLHPRDCIYIMVNGKFCADETTSEEEEADDEHPEYDPEEKSSEIKLVPNDPELLPIIYGALQDCSLLHPDPSSDMSLDEEEDEIGGSGDHADEYDSDEGDGGAPGLDGAGDHGNGYPQHPNQFADADGDESY